MVLDQAVIVVVVVEDSVGVEVVVPVDSGAVVAPVPPEAAAVAIAAETPLTPARIVTAMEAILIFLT